MPLAVLLPVALTILLTGCSPGSERSWAYMYRHTWEEPSVTPRLSSFFRTEAECEKQKAELSTLLRVVDRCVAQPPIPLGWIEWEATIGLRIEASGEQAAERFSFIAQSLPDCWKVRDGMTGLLERDMKSRLPASVTVRVSATSCRPIYIRKREDFTPLQASDIDGILMRSRVADTKK
jgi:hypothetical protein